MYASTCGWKIDTLRAFARALMHWNSKYSIFLRYSWSSCNYRLIIIYMREKKRNKVTTKIFGISPGDDSDSVGIRQPRTTLTTPPAKEKRKAFFKKPVKHLHIILSLQFIHLSNYQLCTFMHLYLFSFFHFITHAHVHTWTLYYFYIAILFFFIIE